MSEHRARTIWQRNTPDFDYASYDRNHRLELGNGDALFVSAAKEFKGDPNHTNPEELFVASLSSCHMLTFLAVAARAGLVVDAYDDDAVGFLEKNDKGKLAVARVLLRPRVSFGGDRDPSVDEIFQLHEKAHAGCFIANSVASNVAIEPQA